MWRSLEARHFMDRCLFVCGCGSFPSLLFDHLSQQFSMARAACEPLCHFSDRFELPFSYSMALPVSLSPGYISQHFHTQHPRLTLLTTFLPEQGTPPPFAVVVKAEVLRHRRTMPSTTTSLLVRLYRSELTHADGIVRIR